MRAAACKLEVTCKEMSCMRGQVKVECTLLRHQQNGRDPPSWLHACILGSPGLSISIVALPGLGGDFLRIRTEVSYACDSCADGLRKLYKNGCLLEGSPANTTPSSPSSCL